VLKKVRLGQVRLCSIVLAKERLCWVRSVLFEFGELVLGWVGLDKVNLGYVCCPGCIQKDIGVGEGV
jgi:hypothetical protein